MPYTATDLPPGTRILYRMQGGHTAEATVLSRPALSVDPQCVVHTEGIIHIEDVVSVTAPSPYEIHPGDIPAHDYLSATREAGPGHDRGSTYTRVMGRTPGGVKLRARVQDHRITVYANNVRIFMDDLGYWVGGVMDPGVLKKVAVLMYQSKCEEPTAPGVPEVVIKQRCWQWECEAYRLLEPYRSEESIMEVWAKAHTQPRYSHRTLRAMLVGKRANEILSVAFRSPDGRDLSGTVESIEHQRMVVRVGGQDVPDIHPAWVTDAHVAEA